MDDSKWLLQTIRLTDFVKRRKTPKQFSYVDWDILKESLHDYTSHFKSGDSFVLFNHECIFIVGLTPSLFSDNHYETLISSFGVTECSKDDQPNTDRIIHYHKQVVSFVLYECFYIRNSNHLTCCVPSNQPVMIQALEAHQFSRDVVMKDRFLINNSYLDGHLMSISKDIFDFNSTGILLFSDHGLMVRATDYAVFEINTFNPNHSIIHDLIPHGNLYHSENAYKILIDVLHQLDEYIKGTRTEFEIITEYYEATNFQKNVWKLCSEIPYGQTASYEEIAIQLDHKINSNKGVNTRYTRAVGVALSKNPIMIVVPCHRVIGKDGKLIGFSGGLDLKDFLLTSEMFDFSNKKRKGIAT